MADRKPRSMRATDEDWERIKAKAKNQGVPVSEFLLAAALREREPRTFEASEAEWALIESRAREAGMSASAFLVNRALLPAGGAEPVGALPVSLLRRFALDIRALAVAEAWRYEAEGEEAAWEAIVSQARNTIDNEPDRS